MNKHSFGHPPLDQRVQFGLQLRLVTFVAGLVHLVGRFTWRRSHLTVLSSRCHRSGQLMVVHVLEVQFRQRLPAGLERVQVEQQVVRREGEDGHVELEGKLRVCKWFWGVSEGHNEPADGRRT